MSMTRNHGVPAEEQQRCGGVRAARRGALRRRHCSECRRQRSDATLPVAGWAAKSGSRLRRSKKSTLARYLRSRQLASTLGVGVGLGKERQLCRGDARPRPVPDLREDHLRGGDTDRYNARRAACRRSSQRSMSDGDDRERAYRGTCSSTCCHLPGAVNFLREAYRRARAGRPAADVGARRDKNRGGRAIPSTARGTPAASAGARPRGAGRPDGARAREHGGTRASRATASSTTSSETPPRRAS